MSGSPTSSRIASNRSCPAISSARAAVSHSTVTNSSLSSSCSASDWRSALSSSTINILRPALMTLPAGFGRPAWPFLRHHRAALSKPAIIRRIHPSHPRYERVKLNRSPRPAPAGGLPATWRRIRGLVDRSAAGCGMAFRSACRESSHANKFAGAAASSPYDARRGVEGEAGARVQDHFDRSARRRPAGADQRGPRPRPRRSPRLRRGEPVLIRDDRLSVLAIAAELVTEENLRRLRQIAGSGARASC